MPDPNPQDEADRAAGRLNLIRFVGLTLFGIGLMLMVGAVVAFVLAVAHDAELHNVGLFYVGLPVMIVGWWFLLDGYRRQNQVISTDCPACGAINDADSVRCGKCDALLD